ncbi:MAG: hypothetical protein MJ224_03220 [archaeon]|nr:hypothetical protein [archaeon]
MSDNQKNNALEMPKNTDLAFFAYGILKPGQLAYPNIKDYVSEKNQTKIKYSMLHRDGIPILLNNDRRYGETMGYILSFNNNKKAYEQICQTISNKLYEWGTIEIENKTVNVLFGKDPEKGSNEIENYIDSINFDGKNDPLFNEGIQVIKKNLKSTDFFMEEGFFELQMNYMLLWSAIDRYCKLRYNQESEHKNRIKLSEEKIFREALNKYAKNKRRAIYNTDTLERRTFTIKNPKFCINYYYTLRCNIVHRGKTSIGDIKMLAKATNELLDIFEYILDKTFKDYEE